MKKIILLPTIFLLVWTGISYAQQGKNGAKVVASTTVVANEYTSLTTNVSAGNNVIKVSSSSLNTHSRFAANLAQGDLIMIIQMQGATINGTSNDSTWGTVTNYNNCGLYEFAEVFSVPDNATINVTCPLLNNYSSSGKVQVVRVPRFTSLTVNAGDTLTCDAWNGTSGGIVVAEVQGSTIINTNGFIAANVKGFRGGALTNTTGPNLNSAFATTSVNGGQKGEGIAGYQTDYTAYGGMYCRGAAANAGGGGNSWNTSGGGGANAGNINYYTGNGNPDTSNSSWKSAWNLEYNGFAYSNSSGGGRGGYSASDANLNPLVVGPNNVSWDASFYRENTGGKGGRPLDYSGGRIFFGGGGGAGHEDNNHGGAGGAGGGIVYLLSYGTVSGSGSIVSNGENGQEDNSQNAYGDGVGGAGGGGTVIVNSVGIISGISIIANGGNGGNQFISNSPVQYEAEGGGGGGGGGYIAISNGTITTQANGGVNGTTNATSLAAFPPDGGTKGGAGIAMATISVSPQSAINAVVSPDVSICNGTTTSLLASGGATYAWSPGAGLTDSTIANPIANPTVTTTYYVAISNGTCQALDSVIVTISGIASGAGTIIADNDSICSNTSTNLNLIGSTGNIQWQSSSNGISFSDISGATDVNYNTGALTDVSYYRVVASGNCGNDTSTVLTISVNPIPVAGIVMASPDSICSGNTSQLNITGSAGIIQWQSSPDGIMFSGITGATSATYNATTLTQTTYYRVILSSQYCGADSSNIQKISVLPQSIAGTLSTAKDSICKGTIGLVSLSGSSGAVQWQSSPTNGNFKNISGITTTSYTTPPLSQTTYYRVIAGNGLCADTSTVFTLFVISPPSASFSDNASGLEVMFNLMGSSGVTGYSWDFGDNSSLSSEANPTHTYDTAGVYDVCLTVRNSSNCNYTECQNVTVFATGISSIGDDISWKAYPNPAGNEFFINTGNSTTRIERIAIYDVTGRVVLNENVSSLPSSVPLKVDISMLSGGAYYLKITSGQMYYVQAIVKQ